MVLEVSDVSIHHHLSLLVGLVVKTKCHGERSVQQRKLLGSREKGQKQERWVGSQWLPSSE